MSETAVLEEVKEEGRKEKIFQEKITCLNRLIGRCHGCIEDYDLSHHPNNLDCSNYRQAKFIQFYVEPIHERSSRERGAYVKENVI